MINTGTIINNGAMIFFMGNGPPAMFGAAPPAPGPGALPGAPPPPPHGVPPAPVPGAPPAPPAFGAAAHIMGHAGVEGFAGYGDEGRAPPAYRAERHGDDLNERKRLFDDIHDHGHGIIDGIDVNNVKRSKRRRYNMDIEDKSDYVLDKICNDSLNIVHDEKYDELLSNNPLKNDNGDGLIDGIDVNNERRRKRRRLIETEDETYDNSSNIETEDKSLINQSKIDNGVDDDGDTVNEQDVELDEKTSEDDEQDCDWNTWTEQEKVLYIMEMRKEDDVYQDLRKRLLDGEKVKIVMPKQIGKGKSYIDGKSLVIMDGQTRICKICGGDLNKDSHPNRHVRGHICIAVGLTWKAKVRTRKQRK